MIGKRDNEVLMAAPCLYVLADAGEAGREDFAGFDRRCTTLTEAASAFLAGMEDSLRAATGLESLRLVVRP